VLDSSFNPPTVAHMRMARSAILSESGRGARKGTNGGSEGGGNKPTTRLLLLLAVNNADKTPQPAEFGHRLCMMYIFAAELLAGLDTQQPPSWQTTEGSAKSAGEGLYIDLGLTTLPYFHSKSAAISSSPFYLPSTSSSSSSLQEAAEMEQVYLAGYDTVIRIFNPKYYTLPPPDSTDNIRSPMTGALGPFFRRSRLRITMRTDSSWGGEEEQRGYLKGLQEGGLEAVGGNNEWVDRIELVEGRREGEVVVSSTAVREAVRGRDEERLGGLVCEGVKRWILEEALYR